jgi:four helix bundle protein
VVVGSIVGTVEKNSKLCKKNFAMATIKSFEELEIWKMARSFSKKVFDLTCNGKFARDFSLKDQINASTGSVMDNISEGFERGGNREFINFLSYAKGSIGESRSQLIRAFDRNYIDEESLTIFKAEAIELGNRIGSFMSYLQRSDYKGSKFHEPQPSYGEQPETLTRNPKLETRNFEPGTLNPKPGTLNSEP